MLDIVSLNVNAFQSGDTGDKAAFFAEIKGRRPDVIALQETGLAAKIPVYARLEGYSLETSSYTRFDGVALLSKRAGRRVADLCAHPGCEGRFIALEFPELTIASVYAPSPQGTNVARLLERIQFLTCLQAFMIELKASPALVAGDFNITLADRDAVPKKKSPWIDQTTSGILQVLIERHGWFDTFRAKDADKFKRRQTVWSGKDAFDANTGFGIDFQIASSGLRSKLVSASVLTPATWQVRYSDHAPTQTKFAIDPVP